MKHSSHLLVAAILSTALSPAARGAILFSDDFESYSADALLTNAGPWGTASTVTAPVIVRDEATATPFGTPNQYLDFNDNAQAAAYRIGLRSFTADLQQVFVDNVSLEEGAAAVPEPASLILLGLGGLALVRRRR